METLRKQFSTELTYFPGKQVQAQKNNKKKD